MTVALSAGSYSMKCWNSTRNPFYLDRPKLLSQCIKLIRSLQPRFTNGEIAVPSCDITGERTGIEIVILARRGNVFFDNIARFLTRTASELRLDYGDFVMQRDELTRYFDEEEIGNISDLSQPLDRDISEKDVEKLEQSVRESSHYQPNNSWQNSIPTEQHVPPITITRRQLRNFYEKEGDALRAEISKVMEGIAAAQELPHSGWQTFFMIAKGVVGVIGAGALLALAVKGVVLFALMSAIGGMAAAAAALAPAFFALLAVISALAGTAYLTFKDARNVLLVINDSTSDVLPITDHIENGERTLVPMSIPAAEPNAAYVHAGIFIYDKFKAGGFSIGTFGSAFAVAFRQLKQGDFSIGMDCPNSIFGGNNSIETCQGNSCGRAMHMALNSGCMHGGINYPKVNVKIADHWGNVNWGRAIVMGN